jgi:hypothetical protein
MAAPLETVNEPDEHGELAVIPEILNPLTGELVPADDVSAVAGAIDMLRDRKRFFDSVISVLTDAAYEQSRIQGTRTFHVGNGMSLVLSAETEVSWDAEKLMADLRAAGLPEDRIDELVTTVVSYKVNGTVARQLARANPEYATVIENAQTRVPSRRSASTRRTP